ncbi:hypothetical protein GWI33_019311 [Rhynchophorus ferrugineus]|uniref:Cytochrome P450 n=1 Tax=Rhynchophorus ferrugineus TaxID=354439 RepID=A0A834M1I0_RHYFE|nr:hypothetical protein GWI33_019311 [Rhynchophorus ferrugineus]
MILTPIEFGALVLGLIVIWVSISLYRLRPILNFAKNYKGYKFYPVLGNYLTLWKRDLYKVHLQTTKELGLPCNLWFGHNYYYLTDDLDVIKVILNHPATIDKGKLYDQLEIVFGDCLLLVSGDTWKDKRKFFSKSFTQSKLTGFVHHFYQNSIVLLDCLKNSGDGDIFHVMGRYTFDSFCDSFLGKNYGLQTNAKNKFIERIDELQAFAGNHFLIPVSFYLPIRLICILGSGTRILKTVNELKQFIKRIIDNKKDELAQNPVVDNQLSFVDIMMSDNQNLFPPEMIQNEFFLFATAATDTIANTSSYIMILLGIYPDIQEKVYEEIITEIGKDKPIVPEDLNRLKYTERFMYESMRIIPAVPIIVRYTTEDIPVGSKVIPKDVNVSISTMNVHRNEKYWPNPMKFDPDRFLPEEVAKRNPYCYLPFSLGARNCIGKNYALLSLKVVIANVVRNYKITTKYKSIEEVPLRSYITMRAAISPDLHFVPRN